MTEVPSLSDTIDTLEEVSNEFKLLTEIVVHTTQLVNNLLDKDKE